MIGDGFQGIILEIVCLKSKILIKISVWLHKYLGRLLIYYIKIVFAIKNIIYS